MFAIARTRFSRSVVLAASIALLATAAHAQQQAAPRAARPLAADGIGFGPANPGGNQANAVPGAPGGAASADFDSLIDLITSTIEVESWQENGTGEGEIMPFPTGVFVDPDGALRFETNKQSRSLTSIRASGAPGADASGSRRASSIKNLATASRLRRPASAAAPDPRVTSPLRFVSLPRLEAAIAARQRAHQPLDPAMLTLAGLERIEYVLVYPETGDLVLAGPAGDWQLAGGGQIVSAATGRPVVRLDDLLALWRRQEAMKSAPFVCSIVPREEALARTQEFLAASAANPIEPSQRRQWLEQLRSTIGVQDVQYDNIAADSRIGRLLLAADYHMKLIGMGLAEGVPGVKSYLATVRLGPGGAPPAMTVLRWWFAMPACTVAASDDRNAFDLPERCIQVLSENELLAARGQRVHTGESEQLNRQFAESFTANYAALAAKYPVYAELERVFELALALALVQREGLAEKVGWSPTLFLDGQRLLLPRIPATTTVETVINHRVIAGRHIIAGVSGGVLVDGQKSLTLASASAEQSTKLAAVKKSPARQAAAPWWWD